MTIAEKPITAVRGSHHATGDGVHMVAQNYKKGVRLDTHMHREAQLVYAASGTMQATTPKRPCLRHTERAVAVAAVPPPPAEHARLRPRNGQVPATAARVSPPADARGLRGLSTR